MRIFCFAGPNGSGKSTTFERIKSVFKDIPFINADLIAASPKLEHITDPNARNLEAAIKAEELREKCLRERTDFAFETVLSTPRNLLFLQKAREQGAKIFTAYILTRDKEINVQRVAKRVSLGGHDVPTDKIKTRYDRCLELLPEVLETSDVVSVFDNTVENKTDLILHKQNDNYLIMSPNYEEDEFLMKNLIGQLPFHKCTFKQPFENLGPYFKSIRRELEL